MTTEPVDPKVIEAEVTEIQRIHERVLFFLSDADANARALAARINASIAKRDGAR